MSGDTHHIWLFGETSRQYGSGSYFWGGIDVDGGAEAFLVQPDVEAVGVGQQDDQAFAALVGDEDRLALASRLLVRLAVHGRVHRVESGCFERGLIAYGWRDRPCGRCGTLIVREAFVNRSSFSCPSCQRAPRVLRA